MLIFTRRFGQSFKIGDEITVTILSQDRSQVRIGVTAPKNVAVHREEVFDRIHKGDDDKKG